MSQNVITMNNYQFEQRARATRQTALWITVVVHVLVIAAIILSSDHGSASRPRANNDQPQATQESLSANRP